MSEKDQTYFQTVKKIAADALLDIKTDRPHADNYGGCDTSTPLGKVTLTVLNKVDDYVGGNAIWYVPSEYHTELVDVITEIIQQGLSLSANLYEQPAIENTEDEDSCPKTPEAIEDQRIADLNYELRHFHAIADRWGNKPGLTQLEACHGAVREAYGVRFSGVVPQQQPAGDFNPGRVYDALYDMSNAELIQVRTIRAAKDLFKD